MKSCLERNRDKTFNSNHDMRGKNLKFHKCKHSETEFENALKYANVNLEIDKLM